MALSLDGEERRRVAADVRFLVGSGVPLDGASGTGAGVAGPSSLYFDFTNHIIYVNVGTKAVPAWDVFGISNIPDGSITTAMLQDLAVTGAKIAAGTISTSKYGALSVDTAAIAALAVTTAKIANGAVGTTQLANLAATTAIINDLAVTTGKLAANAVTPAKTATSMFQQATGTISSADITGTGAGQFGHANGYILLAGQGAHNVVELISGIFVYDFATAAYTAGGNVTINRSGGAGALTGLISAANSFGAAGDKIVQFLPLTTAGINLTENEGLNLVTTAAFTQPGTAAGVIRYVLNYRVHATAL